MAGYRLYFFDPFSGHIDHSREFVADDDQAAIALSEGWRDRQAMELWQGGRKVSSWDKANR